MAKKDKKFFEGLGRRKESVARVRLTETEKDPGISINEKDLEVFLPILELKETVTAPLRATGMDKKFDITVRAKGGGVRGQAEAIKMGLSRALVKYNGEFHQTLKDLDYLKRDSRRKERKKPGLKKARRAAQWRKR
ncbi:MAG: 30S ribosomal protein S9 [Candidatus Moranbacteria bacterium]|nr:30S ribosomal protein S9 [Candidatus Moranbacteria bacterium]